MEHKGKQLKVAKLLASTVPLVLEVEGDHKLELKLAWTVRAVMQIEAKLREYGVAVNILQNAGEFWSGIDTARLAISVWATALQEQPEYGTDEGFEVIASFIVPETHLAALTALREAFLASLSQKQRDAVKRAEDDGGIEESAEPGQKPVQEQLDRGV